MANTAAIRSARAAAGLIGLRDMRARLGDDHVRAEHLARGLSKIPGVTVHSVYQRTNMVYFSIPEIINTANFIGALKEKNILIIGGPRFRAVTHYWIDDENISQVVEAIRIATRH